MIEIPEKMLPFTDPIRYKIARGGRGSGKSWTIARLLLTYSIYKTIRILCAREIQNSIKESVKKLLENQIKNMGWDEYFYITKDSITCKRTGSEFIFKGMYRNVETIKSLEDINYCWVEEADKISAESLKILLPTIRTEDSEIWFSYNPKDEDAPIETEFVQTNRQNMVVVDINYPDNPWFTNALTEEMEWDKQHDYDGYLHIWEGNFLTNSEQRIFSGKWISEYFETPDKVYFYFGADWGFSQDPTTLIRSFILDKTLYIDDEVYKVGLDIDKTPDMFATIPNSKIYPVNADNARPETISYMKQHGFPLMRSSKKGKNSIEDGIEFIKSFDQIIIHPRCKKTVDEFKLYSYVVNKLTGEITRKPEDKHNHCIDALRYALEALMRNRLAGMPKFRASDLGL